ncbi:MAG: diacylglycerol kinase family lipid kinase [Candidatus Krumholzibacteriia bacterium]
MTEFHRALLVVNLVAGQGRGRFTHGRVRRGLEAHGIACTERFTSPTERGNAWARRAGDEGFDLIVVIGGDGTLQEVVAGQARAERKVTIAFVPSGTANVVGIALSLPWLPGAAVETILAGRVREFDVGYLPEVDRHFILMAAIGYPARIIEGSTRRLKNILGVFAYAWSGARSLFTPRHARVTITLDGDVHSFVAHTILVTNIGAIADLGLRVSPETSPHDGRFDLSVISNRTLWDLVPVLLRMFTWRRPARRLRYLDARSVRIDADPPLPVQIDGESLGATPFAADVLPGAVRLVVGSRYLRRTSSRPDAVDRHQTGRV